MYQETLNNFEHRHQGTIVLVVSVNLMESVNFFFQKPTNKTEGTFLAKNVKSFGKVTVTQQNRIFLAAFGRNIWIFLYVQF